MAWYPKAIRKPITRHDTPMLRYRGICHHVAVSEGTSLFSYFNIPGNATSHFYVRRTGKVEQYVDTKFRAPAQLEGNPTMISIETQGGKVNADTEPWDPAQVEALIELDAWIAKTHGIPLQMMKDSKPTSKGFGYHKLGVNPYRVDGGELWSKATGKICPGGAKIKQISSSILPGVIKLLGGTDTEDELSAADVKAINEYTEARLKAYFTHLEQPNGNIDQQLAHTETAVKTMVDGAEARIAGLVEEAKKAILEYTRVATISIKDYVRQDGDAGEAAILGAVAAVQADVDKIEEAVEAPKG